jgi:putative DNA primase/helicase
MTMTNKIVPLNAWHGKIQKDGRGKPRRNLHNLFLFLKESPGLGRSLRFNEFAGRVEWNGAPLADEDIIEIRLIIEEAGAALDFEPQAADVRQAVYRHAQENKFDPVREYLDGLKWDAKPRLDTWLKAYMGAPDHEMIAVFGAKFLIGSVARAYSPGCQMDNMLLFEGKQGAGKTTAVAALFGRDYMISSISDFKSRDASIYLQGRWVAEIAELAALSKTDIRDVKKFLTETVDQYRPVNGKEVIDRPRRTVFVGTTNEHQYLKDATGNRRFWPVPCGVVKVEAIAEDRDQLWAEAVHRYRAGEPWWLTDDAQIAAAENVQGDRAEQDPWGEFIDAWFEGPENRSIEFTTGATVLRHALKMTADRINKMDEMRVANHLTKRGWKRVKRRPHAGAKAIWGWAK